MKEVQQNLIHLENFSDLNQSVSYGLSLESLNRYPANLVHNELALFDESYSLENITVSLANNAYVETDLNERANFKDSLIGQLFDKFNEHQIVFIDAAVEDYQTIVDRLSGSSKIVVLDIQSDGLTQISKVLSEYQDLDGIEIISHGNSGQLLFGNTVLTKDNLFEYSNVLASWQNSLSEQGDIFLYGCNLAADVDGIAFVTELSKLTNTDIAASTDATGAKEFGGDWGLEFTVGDIETKPSVTAEIEDNYNHLLYYNSDSFKFIDLAIDLHYLIDYKFSYTNFSEQFKFDDLSKLDASDIRAIKLSFQGDELFDSNFYLSHNLDVAKLGMNPFTHYMEYGWKEGRDPNCLFDTSFYLEKNIDIRQAGINPFKHFMQTGYKYGLDPNVLFDTSYYLDKNLDVKKIGMNPLEHYVEYGFKEGRDPFALFDTSYYLDKNLDVKKAGLNPLGHYVQYGFKEGRDPFTLFDTSYYLAKNLDVKKAGLNPLQHFVEYGYKEGRSPFLLFDTSYYVNKYPTVLKSGINPLVDFVNSGFTKNYNKASEFSHQILLAQSVYQGGSNNPIGNLIFLGGTLIYDAASKLWRFSTQAIESFSDLTTNPPPFPGTQEGTINFEFFPKDAGVFNRILDSSIFANPTQLDDFSRISITTFPKDSTIAQLINKPLIFPAEQPQGLYFLESNSNGIPVTIIGEADYPKEIPQATRLVELEGGGTFQFLRNNQQGIEGYFVSNAGNTPKKAVSLKDFSGTSNLSYIIGRINTNANKIKLEGIKEPVLFRGELKQFTAEEVLNFVKNGPIKNFPFEGVFERLYFDTSTGTVVVDKSGVYLK